MASGGDAGNYVATGAREEGLAGTVPEADGGTHPRARKQGDDGGDGNVPTLRQERCDLGCHRIHLLSR